MRKKTSLHEKATVPCTSFLVAPWRSEDPRANFGTSLKERHSHCIRSRILVVLVPSTRLNSPISTMSLRRNTNRNKHRGNNRQQARHLQQLLGSSRAYSPGCLPAAVGKVYSIGAQVEFGFKYRVKLAEDSDVQSFLSEVPVSPAIAIQESPNGFDMVDEEILIQPKASEIDGMLDGIYHFSSDTYEEETLLLIDEQKLQQQEQEVVEEPQTPIGVAQMILEKRIQNHLQKKLLYCPGSGADAKDLSIDGIAVDLTSFHEPDECIDAAQTSCMLTGSITIYQKFNNIHGSSLQSIQAGLSTLRIGMNEESAYVNEGDIFNEVEFLGGIIGISREGQGSTGEGRDISLNNGSAGVSAVILSQASFIDTHTEKLSTTGQGIIGIFAMALLALVVARRKARNSNRAVGINEIAVDDLQSHSAEDDSWTEDGLGAEDPAQSDMQSSDSEEIMRPSVEVYPKQEKKRNKYGFSKKRTFDHVSVAGM